MKRNIIHTLWTAAVLLTACTQEELPLPGADDAAPLTITVTDGGYAPTASPGDMQKTLTRATESDYRTEFTAGDECGLYIVRGGTVVCENVKLTAAGSDGNLTWLPAADVTLTGGLENEHYFLYYPYQETAKMEGKINATATGDGDFFAPLINGWQPATDQSDYAAGYTASDLMTATGTAVRADGKLMLSFAMTHRMALAVIEMPKTVYKFTDTSIPDYTVPTAADFTPEAKPCRNSDGTYRYIVNPKQPASLTGSYDDGKKEFTITPNSIGAGNYKTYKVDGAQTVEKGHNLQVGDYLLADGSLVGKKKTLTEEQKASVSAIVFWTPAKTDYTPGNRQTPARLTDDKIMSTDYPGCNHGLAVSVRDVTSLGSWQDEYVWEYVKYWQAGENFIHKNKEHFVSVASTHHAASNIDKIYGYQNTVVLRAYNKYCLETEGKSYSIVYLVTDLDNFVNANPAPSGSTGWFLPSVKELHMLCYKDVDNVFNEHDESYGTTRDIVNAFLTSVGGEALESTYWSSSEYALNDGFAFRVDFNNAGVGVNYLYSGHRVRAVCAF